MKKINNLGFTLIELLAVIVILAIIALIAVPIILGIIDDTKVSADQRSKELYLDAVTNAIAHRNLKEDFRPTECTIKEDGNIDCEGISLNIDTDGRRPVCGNIKVNNGKVSSNDLSFDENSCSNNDKGNDEDKDSKTPDLVNGLIPVKYDGTNWVIADTTKEWYNYDNQEWANAIILKTGIEKSIGNTVDVGSEVQAMFVWIPRYEYKIEGQYGKHPDGTEGTKKLPGEIKINFIDKNVTTASEGYIVHPAFAFGEEELSGIWVGKFETTGTADNPTILPGVTSLLESNLGFSKQKISGQFETAQKFSMYVANMDSHMSKNSEWGAIAYLSQSKYGKYGNPKYTGTDKKISRNNCSNHITGIGQDISSSNSTDTCAINTYETEKGQAASTTGNITGVYDMNGGSWESVMGVYRGSNASSVWGSSSSNNYAGFTSVPDSKYYDEYTSNVTIASSLGALCPDDICNGHALIETSEWYEGRANSINAANPWFKRGSSSIFESYFDGGSNSDNAFRVILTHVS